MKEIVERWAADETVEHVAVLLAAVENVLGDDLNAADAVGYARRLWTATRDASSTWVGRTHYGDCTNQAISCATCIVEGYEERARELIGEYQRGER